MNLILLDSDMFLDRYDSNLCCRRLVRYVKDNPVDLIAVADFQKQKREIWEKLKGFCSKVHYFLDQIILKSNWAVFRSVLSIMVCNAMNSLFLPSQGLLRRSRWIRRFPGVILCWIC